MVLLFPHSIEMSGNECFSVLLDPGMINEVGRVVPFYFLVLLVVFQLFRQATPDHAVHFLQ